MGEGWGFATLPVAKDLLLGLQQHVHSFTKPSLIHVIIQLPHLWNNSACVKQLKGSEVIFRSEQGPLRIVLFFSNAFDFTTHTP